MSLRRTTPCTASSAPCYARTNGRTLLVLDTERDSAAESIYRHLKRQQ